jgi:hypothetical protein
MMIAAGRRASFTIANLAQLQDWRRLYFFAMTYVTALAWKRLYTPFVIKTLLSTEEL